MHTTSRFIVLIERRRLLKTLAGLLAAASLLAASLGWQGAHAQTAPSGKIAADLSRVIHAATTPTVSFAKDVSGVRMVKVLIVSNSSDPDLASLRSNVLANGGSVYLRFVSVTAVSAMLPANEVAAIAARADVQSISPNRLTARTASVLETTVGALTPNVRSSNGSAGSLGYTGLDGAGVGIAVLDSGITTYSK